MPNNTINISLDLLGLQGAKRITGKDGREYVAICLPESRVNAHSNGKCYLSLDVKANPKGTDDYGKTHFVCEAATKDERQSKVRLPIIGNGKEFVFDQQPAPRQQQQRPAPHGRTEMHRPHEQQAESYHDGMDDDSSIPF